MYIFFWGTNTRYPQPPSILKPKPYHNSGSSFFISHAINRLPFALAAQVNIKIAKGNFVKLPPIDGAQPKENRSPEA